jgi:hypothetical protein
LMSVMARWICVASVRMLLLRMVVDLLFACRDARRCHPGARRDPREA